MERANTHFGNAHLSRRRSRVRVPSVIESVAYIVQKSKERLVASEVRIDVKKMPGDYDLVIERRDGKRLSQHSPLAPSHHHARAAGQLEAAEKDLRCSGVTALPSLGNQVVTAVLDSPALTSKPALLGYTRKLRRSGGAGRRAGLQNPVAEKAPIFTVTVYTVNPENSIFAAFRCIALHT